jgi:Rho-type GTPase-activating protein 1/2
MFGRDLAEQVQADAKGSPDRQVPLIVEKCVEAVEATGSFTVVKHQVTWL